MNSPAERLKEKTLFYHKATGFRKAIFLDEGCFNPKDLFVPYSDALEILKDSYSKKQIEKPIDEQIEKYRKNIKDWENDLQHSQKEKNLGIADNKLILYLLEMLKGKILNAPQPPLKGE